MPVSLAALLLLGPGTVYVAQSEPIVMPGAPGQSSRVIERRERRRGWRTPVTRRPTQTFMQHMIVHHQQAVDMVALAKARTNNPSILAIGGRIDASQADEMKFMRRWLTDRREPLTVADMEHARHAMKGMASEEQLARLAGARGTAFDRLPRRCLPCRSQSAIDQRRWPIG